MDVTKCIHAVRFCAWESDDWECANCGVKGKFSTHVEPVDTACAFLHPSLKPVIRSLNEAD